MKVLFIGDVVGGPGRRGLRSAMPGLRERHSPDFVVVNGENSAGGMGITEKTARDLFDAGADVITSGNHVYRHREVYDFLDSSDRVIRRPTIRTPIRGGGIPWSRSMGSGWE